MSTATLITVLVVALVPLLPTEPVLVGVGALAAATHAVPISVILVGGLGCTISDHLLYFLGRGAGARLLVWLVRKPAGAAVTNWLSRHVTRWGASVLVAGRWLPGGGTVGAVLAGTLCWRLRQFTLASVTGSLLWSAYVTLLGYCGGSITNQPLTGALLSLGIAAVLATATGVAVRRTNRRDTAALPTDAMPTDALPTDVMPTERADQSDQLATSA